MARDELLIIYTNNICVLLIDTTLLIFYASIARVNAKDKLDAEMLRYRMLPRVENLRENYGEADLIIIGCSGLIRFVPICPIKLIINSTIWNW